MIVTQGSGSDSDSSSLVARKRDAAKRVPSMPMFNELKHCVTFEILLKGHVAIQ